MCQKLALFFVIGLIVTYFLPNQILAQTTQPDTLAVFLGSDGSVRFEEPEPVRYVSTGLKVTEEAQVYPGAIAELLKSEKSVVRVQTVLVSSRMTGLLTWQVKEEASLVLVRDDDIITVREPGTEAERLTETKEVTNPFGLFALCFFGFLGLGNLLMEKYADLDLAFAILAFIVALATVFAALALLAALATVFAALALLSTALAVATNRSKFFRWSSGVGALLMVVAVVGAIW